MATMTVVVASFAQATIYTGGSPSTTGVVPDGSPVGLASAIEVNTGGDSSLINGVEVTLHLTGGFNGDLYGYLVNPNGNMAVLLNRVGQTGGNFGYSDAGMNVILSDAGMPGVTLAGDIHTYGAGDIASGTTAWRPDNGGTDFTGLQNGSANGSWTLFLADLSGGEQSSLVSWGLTVSVVPEPVTWALFLFAAMVALVGLGVMMRGRSGVSKLPGKIIAWMNAV